MILLIVLKASISIVIISSCSKDEVENPVTQTNINHAPGDPSNPSPADGTIMFQDSSHFLGPVLIRMQVIL